MTPVTTVANARTARGILDVDELRSSLREAMPACEVRMIHCGCGPASGNVKSVASRIDELVAVHPHTTPSASTDGGYQEWQ
jgi:hypothetical protein